MKDRQPKIFSFEQIAPYANEAIVLTNAARNGGMLVVPERGPGTYSLRNAAKRAESAIIAEQFGKDLPQRRKDNLALRDRNTPRHPTITTVFSRR